MVAVMTSNDELHTEYFARDVRTNDMLFYVRFSLTHLSASALV